MATLENVVVPKNSGGAFVVKKGQRIRIAGRTIVDFVAFNLHDLRERFDQARTKTNQAKVFISIGDQLISTRGSGLAVEHVIVISPARDWRSNASMLDPTPRLL